MGILKILDDDLKKRSPKCHVCGLPKNGIIPLGLTKKSCGICDCDEKNV